MGPSGHTYFGYCPFNVELDRLVMNDSVVLDQTRDLPITLALGDYCATPLNDKVKVEVRKQIDTLLHDWHSYETKEITYTKKGRQITSIEKVPMSNWLGVMTNGTSKEAAFDFLFKIPSEWPSMNLEKRASTLQGFNIKRIFDLIFSDIYYGRVDTAGRSSLYAPFLRDQLFKDSELESQDKGLIAKVEDAVGIPNMPLSEHVKNELPNDTKWTDLDHADWIDQKTNKKRMPSCFTATDGTRMTPRSFYEQYPHRWRTGFWPELNEEDKEIVTIIRDTVFSKLAHEWDFGGRPRPLIEITNIRTFVRKCVGLIHPGSDMLRAGHPPGWRLQVNNGVDRSKDKLRTDEEIEELKEIIKTALDNDFEFKASSDTANVFQSLGFVAASNSNYQQTAYRIDNLLKEGMIGTIGIPPVALTDLVIGMTYVGRKLGVIRDPSNERTEEEMAAFRVRGQESSKPGHRFMREYTATKINIDIHRYRRALGSIHVCTDLESDDFMCLRLLAHFCSYVTVHICVWPREYDGMRTDDDGTKKSSSKMLFDAAVAYLNKSKPDNVTISMEPITCHFKSPNVTEACKHALSLYHEDMWDMIYEMLMFRFENGDSIHSAADLGKMARKLIHGTNDTEPRRKAINQLLTYTGDVKIYMTGATVENMITYNPTKRTLGAWAEEANHLVKNGGGCMKLVPLSPVDEGRYEFAHAKQIISRNHPTLKTLDIRNGMFGGGASVQYIRDGTVTSVDITSLKDIIDPIITRDKHNSLDDILPVIDKKVKELFESVPLFTGHVVVGTNLANGIAALMGWKKGEPRTGMNIVVTKEGELQPSMDTVTTFWNKLTPDIGKYASFVCLASVLYSKIEVGSKVVVLSEDCNKTDRVKWIDMVKQIEPFATEFGSTGMKFLKEKTKMKDYKNAQQIARDMMQYDYMSVIRPPN